MIKANNLSYVYDNGAEAVVDSTFTIGPGLYLMLGENGAGKTTLLHVLSGLLYP
ncbi:MAG: AAA family ATPase, partial [Duncaniella sp.]|nr:AAA family ATPase [Duncaniella sp.]